MKPLPMNPTPSRPAMGMNYSSPPTMTAASTRLSVMMFLEYLIWGSWLPLLALYLGGVLGFSGAQIGYVFATQAIACVFGLYFGGQIADRLLSEAADARETPLSPETAALIESYTALKAPAREAAGRIETLIRPHKLDLGGA